jgi:hypothetical protein
LLVKEDNEIEEARNGKNNNTNALSTRRFMRIRSALIISISGEENTK